MIDNRVSVIIPCGGWHGKYVADAVNSCLKAEPPPDEIIVVDDCAIPPVCLNQNHSVKSHRFDDHRGRSCARNFGVKQATSPWIYFLDADDFLEPTAILDFRKIFFNAWVITPELIYADYDYLDRLGNRVRVQKTPFSRNFVRNRRTGRNISGISDCNHANIGLFVRRDRFLEIGGFDEDMSIAEYWDFFLRYAANPKIRVHKHDRPFFVARQSSSVMPHPERLMAYASNKMRALIRGGYYEEWKER